jgi:hypothetical protein
VSYVPFDDRIGRDESEDEVFTRTYGPEDDVDPLALYQDRPDEVITARKALTPVEQSLRDAGFYAYGTFDDQHRWTVASDDEAGRIDVRVGRDGYEIELWATSPGLFADIENEWRRRAMERLARMQLQRVSHGMLEAHQSAEWDEVDHGVGVRITFEVPFTRGQEIGSIVRSRLLELENLLTFVESQVGS